MKNKIISPKAFLLLGFSITTVLFSLISCQKSNTFYVKTYDKSPVVNEVKLNNINNDFPIAGTVSHHFLTDFYIDYWFKTLKEQRNVKNFFIISPSHYKKEKNYISLTTGKWILPNNTSISSNDKIVNNILKSINQKEDKDVFVGEHGVETLIPYIIKYFPNAKIVPIIVVGDPPIELIESKKLTTALKPFFRTSKTTENFLLISTDFSHHQNLETTLFRDNKSEKFFINPRNTNFYYAICDNRPSMYVLANVFPKDIKSTILCNTNSFYLSEEGEDDITSYFFTFFSFK